LLAAFERRRRFDASFATKWDDWRSDDEDDRRHVLVLTTPPSELPEDGSVHGPVPSREQSAYGSGDLGMVERL
jgi:hypothetical protein